MYKGLVGLLSALFIMLMCSTAALAQDYSVPIIVGSKTYTLMVSTTDSTIIVTSTTPEMKVGAVQSTVTVAVTSAVTMTLPVATVETTKTVDSQALRATAVTIDYDDLFRYNERHIGKVVRYVGEVLEYGDRSCLLCDDPGHYLRIGVTPLGYGLYDDPIYIVYNGNQRFLKDDVVTVWGIVDGLESYIAVLGNEVTIPRIVALDVVLGEVSNPKVAAQPGQPVANRNANLRAGPGTDFALVGGVDAGQPLTIKARNPDGSWFQLEDGTWIASFLVDNAPSAAEVPVAENIPEAAAAEPKVAESEVATTGGSTATVPTEQPTVVEASAASNNSSILSIGQEVEIGGWRFKVTEVHKRKAVYFYDDSYVAMGHFLIVLLDATNMQSGTDYFARNIEPWITDDPGNVYSLSVSGSSYARWQYGGLTSIYADVNPGNFARIVMAFDVPDSLGHALLSTDVGKWVDLGDFSTITSEDN